MNTDLSITSDAEDAVGIADGDYEIEPAVAVEVAEFHAARAKGNVERLGGRFLPAKRGPGGQAAADFDSAVGAVGGEQVSAPVCAVTLPV